MAVDTNLLGKSLISDDYRKLASQAGLPGDLPGGTHRAGAYNYNVVDTGDGRRTITRDPYSPTLDDVGGSMVDFAKQLNTDQNNIFKEYLGAVQQQDSPLDIYRSLLDESGIPTLQKTAGSLQGQINNLEDSIDRAKSNVEATTQNSFVTEGQRAGMVEARRAPLLENISGLSRDLGRVQQSIDAGKSDVSNITGLALQGQELALRPFEMQIEMASDQSARLMTGFSADRQSQLDILMNKLQREYQLEDREWELANQLAAEERAFSRQKDMLKLQYEQEGGSGGLLSVGEGTTLFDPKTNSVVYKAPKTYKGGGGGGAVNPFKYTKPPLSSFFE